MEAVDALKSVLCGPDGKCCIAGSQADRDTVDTALASVHHYLDQHKAELPLLPDTYGSVEEQIVERYRVGKTQGGFWPSCVKAGDGNMDVFVGSAKQAENVRQALQTACLDGAFIASQKAKEQYKDYDQQCAAQVRKLALEEAIAICRRNAQNTSADELEALKGELK